MRELFERIISGDSSKVLPVLVEKEAGTYDLCITSPPYWKLVEYKSGDGDLSMMCESDFELYLMWIFKYIGRLLNNRGTLVSQWEDLTINRPDGFTGEYMLSSINTAAENAGMMLYARYIWKKFRSKPSVMYSTYDMAQSRLARPNPNWTYAFVYKKKGKTDMSPSKTEVTREEWADWGSDAVWDFPNPGVTINGATGNTGCDTPFAPEFVDRFLKLYTAPGDKVIEPFLGSGTTMKQCIENGRSCTGIELNKTFVQGLKKRVGWGTQSLVYKMKYEYIDMSNL